jgi:hypothetical protein
VRFGTDFFLLTPLMDQLTATLHLQGMNPFNLENLWSGFLQYPALLFFAYLVVLTFSITGITVRNISSTGGGACTAASQSAGYESVVG